MDQFTSGTALGAVISPWWLPELEAVSHGAALLLPIAGLIWLIVQIVRALRTWPGK